MSDEQPTAVGRAKEAVDRSRHVAGLIADSELDLADTLEHLAEANPARASRLRALADHARAFGESERRAAVTPRARQGSTEAIEPEQERMSDDELGIHRE